MRSAPCRASACATSWPMTVARPASSFAIGKIPVYTATLPPGRQNAFACFGSSMTVNSHWYSGFSAAAAMRRPTSCTGSVKRGSWEIFSCFSTCW
jgi:hypothetical protein